MRRIKRRAETVARIKELALRQLAEVGDAGVNLRAIARELEMSSAGIYRYYANRDDLLVALITDGFDSLGAHLRRAVGDDAPTPDRALIDLLGAYRSLATASPHLFALLFTDPVPGFVAPEDGRTTPAVRQAMAPLTSTAALVIDPSWSSDTSNNGADHGGPLPPHVFSGLLRIWSVVHGVVSLELFHHLDWAEADVDSEFDRRDRQPRRRRTQPCRLRTHRVHDARLDRHCSSLPLVRAGQVVHLRNTGTLPHDFTIAELDIAAYVPPGRDTYLRLPSSTAETFGVVCTIGDHADLGMRLDVAEPA